MGRKPSRDRAEQEALQIPLRAHGGRPSDTARGPEADIALAQPDRDARYGGVEIGSRYNEGKSIDAVLRSIEARHQAVRLNDGRSPDDLNDPDPLRRVDYVCAVGKTLHAFEHTGIEPFADHTGLEVHNRKLFAPIVTRFSNRLDRELWEFHVSVEASAGLTGAQFPPSRSRSDGPSRRRSSTRPSAFF